MQSNNKILTGVTAEYVRQFKAQGFTALRASLLLGITPAAASQYLKNKRGADIPLKPETVKAIKRAVAKAQVPRAELFRACLIEVMLGQVVIKHRKPKGKNEPFDYPMDSDTGALLHD